MVVLEALSKRFGTEDLAAVDGVSLEIERGTSLALMGPSGAGKSTLLNLIAGIEKPSSGEILVEGKPLHARGDLSGYRASTVGIVFQFHHLLPGLTAFENIQIPLYAQNILPRTRRQRAASQLERVGGNHLMHKPPERMSGGERQLVAVARALVNDPKILLADEPTGSLDAAASAHVIELLRAYSRESDAVLIVATHNSNVAAAMQRKVAMAFGRLEETDLPAGGEVPAYRQGPNGD